MAVMLEQLGAELSIIKSARWNCDWNRTLHFCRTELISRDAHYEPTPDDDLLHDVLLKGLHRGKRPFASHFAEQRIVTRYGRCFGLRAEEGADRGSITYSHDGTLPERYRDFTEIRSPWAGKPEDVAFDPEHPDNERELFRQLLERFGPRIAHCITPQAEVSTFLPVTEAAAFAAQRVDFLLSFPNECGLLIEPGDHDTGAQIALDRRRDEAFRGMGIETLRPRNAEIREPHLYDQISEKLEQLDVTRFLGAAFEVETEEQHAANHLFLLPSLVVRLERLLAHFFLRQGLIHRPELRVGIIERDLECAELAMASFLDRLTRLSSLYGIALAIPEMQLYVQRNAATWRGALEQLEMPPEVRESEVCESLEGLPLDLLLDVGIKCNALTRPVSAGAPHIGSVRQAFPHNRPVRFAYRAQARSIVLGEDTDRVLESFVRDFFRKHALRPGQAPILRNVLSQRATIGLLPTSAGKSLCYQLAALLTPGTTIVVDPIVALMEDQVQSLKEQFGIDRVLAWYAGAGLRDRNVAALLGENIMVFISPERLQRPPFRAAMQGLKAADIFINYAVIDEAHCVSMWGHDFRPSYLTLERNFRKYCTFQGRAPVIVALTGTASQLVLIDLKRELNIQDMEAIIRPKTFDRPELNFNLVKCPSDDAPEMLEQVMAGIARRLNVQELDTEAHGIVFAYTRNELWKLFGRRVGNAREHVRTVLNRKRDGDLRYGIYTGSPPPAAGLNSEQWTNYKSKTLAAFKRGEINILFGNTAVSVGIDNERLNYIINYQMPQSMEGYYQQCGRAGRSKQRSECYLIFSDDAPADTQRWLNREIPRMGKRWDGPGTAAFFQESNFPGQEKDVKRALKVCARLLRASDDKGLVEVPEYPTLDMPRAEAERTERYISYWLILGVVEDYEVTGMEKNTVYHVRRHAVVERFLRDHNEAPLTAHIVDSLHRYLSRYRPTSGADVERGLAARPEKNLSARSIAYLVDFIYRQIEYQRRAAIRTMVSFCNETDTSPERLRERIRSYFDRSEKFSDGLLGMADVAPEFAAVAVLLDRVEGFDDAEHLYGETRRLLDERFRPDWAAANMFAIAYRERAKFSDTFMRLLDDMVAGLAEEPQAEEGAARFIDSFLTYLSRLDRIFGEPVSGPLLARCMGRLYENHGLTYVGQIDEMDVPDDVREQMRLKVVNLQLKEMTHAHYSRVIG